VPKKILLVEDNPANMKLVQMLLEPHGYLLLEATDGVEALRMAQDQRPDLIIMDIQLPRMSGVEVVKTLRRRPEMDSMPIIAVTAYAMKGDEEKLMQAGCNAYVPKPINTRDLPILVAELLEGQQNTGTTDR